MRVLLLALAALLLGCPHATYLGLMALEDGRLDEAIDALATSTRLDPKKAAAWLDLGLADSRAGRFEDAADAFSACLAAQPDEVTCRKGLALSRSRQALVDAAAAPSDSRR